MEDLQEEIVAVWREVLQLEHVDIRDNFFDVGGTSVLLAQAHAKLMAVLDCEFSQMDLLRYPTIEALTGRLSSYIDRQKEKS